MSYNRWLYVLGNPINFTDPSGFCRQPEKADQACWDTLKDIEQSYPYLDLQTDLDDSHFWTQEELQVLRSDFELLDLAGVDISPYFADGEIRIKRYHESGATCGSFKKYQYWLNIGAMKVTDTYFTMHSGCLGMPIHEIAQWWGYRDNLFSTFEEYVGARTKFFFWYDPGDESPPTYGDSDKLNRAEDFAESVNEYVLLLTNNGGTTGIEPGQKRWEFAKTLLETGKPPPPPLGYNSPTPPMWNTDRCSPIFAMDY